MLLILYTIKNKTNGLPVIAMVLNFSWEINAIVSDMATSHIMLGHVSWMMLDLIIVVLVIIYTHPFEEYKCCS